MGLSKLLEEPPYLSFKELKYAGVRVFFSPAIERLYWELDGVFPTAISVMKTPDGAKDNLEPFFRPDTGTWHEISQLPLTEPKASSLEVSVYDLGQWEYRWAEEHEYHRGATHNCGQEWVTYGDLDDDVRRYWDLQKKDGSWTEPSSTEFLIKCCGEDRPLRKLDPKLVVTAGSEDFVTVRDFVSAVHPWLMSLRGDIFKAKDVSHENPYEPPERYEWMVDLHRRCSESLEIMEKREWVRHHSPYTPRPLNPSESKIMEKIRANMAEQRAMRNEGVLEVRAQVAQ